jgi:hypothetical protein
MKKVLLLLITILTMLAIVGCGSNQGLNVESPVNETIAGGYFNIINKWHDEDGGWCYLVYAADTKVKFFLKDNDEQYVITELYNKDGTLQYYEEVENCKYCDECGHVASVIDDYCSECGTKLIKED